MVILTGPSRPNSRIEYSKSNFSGPRSPNELLSSLTSTSNAIESVFTCDSRASMMVTAPSRPTIRFQTGPEGTFPSKEYCKPRYSTRILMKDPSSPTISQTKPTQLYLLQEQPLLVPRAVSCFPPSHTTAPSMCRQSPLQLRVLQVRYSMLCTRQDRRTTKRKSPERVRVPRKARDRRGDPPPFVVRTQMRTAQA